MKLVSKKIVAALMAVVLVFGGVVVPAERASASYADGVTEKMCHADYWAGLSENPDEVLLSSKEIKTLNQEILKAEGTQMHDLENMSMECDVPTLLENLSKEVVPESELYVNEVLLENKDSYFEAMRSNIKAGVAVGKDSAGKDSAGYMICVGRADMRSWPTADYIGYGKGDTDDEFKLSAMNVNEPFVAKVMTADKKFCWGYSTNCTGWVETEKLALCSTKEEWLDAWKVTNQNILVVAKDQVTLEPSYLDPEVSEVKLMLGTVLKLVPKYDLPKNICERGTWNNEVVYLPTRDAAGNYHKRQALISQHEGLHKGYLPLTQENILIVAFECLGDRYGWGGMLGAMDCSLYIRNIYRCFGLELPRNTTWQQAIPGKKTDLQELGDEEKKALLDEAPAGAMLYFPGHAMMYLGKSQGRYYVISALGSVYDVGDTTVHSINSVAINSLDVKRGNGNTWLTNLSGMVVLGAPEKNMFVGLKKFLQKIL